MDCTEPVYNILSALSMLFSVVAMAVARKAHANAPKKRTRKKKVVSSDGIVYKEVQLCLLRPTK